MYRNLPNISIAPSTQDSITYEAAFNNYKNNDCAKASKGFANYISRFPGGYFMLKANYFKAECDYKLKNNDDALTCYEYVVSNTRSDYTERSTRQAAILYFGKKNYEKAYEYYAALERIAGNKDNLHVSLLGQMRCAGLMQKTAQRPQLHLNTSIRVLLEKMDWWKPATTQVSFISAAISLILLCLIFNLF
jgi:tetratricopeptide (TPR) repeat protein